MFYRQRKMDAENQVFIYRVGQLPMVKAAYERATSAYEATKNYNQLLNATLQMAENSVKYASETEPVKKALNNPRKFHLITLIYHQDFLSNLEETFDWKNLGRILFWLNFCGLIYQIGKWISYFSCFCGESYRRWTIGQIGGEISVDQDDSWRGKWNFLKSFCLDNISIFVQLLAVSKDYYENSRIKDGVEKLYSVKDYSVAKVSRFFKNLA